MLLKWKSEGEHLYLVADEDILSCMEFIGCEQHHTCNEKDYDLDIIAIDDQAQVIVWDWPVGTEGNTSSLNYDYDYGQWQQIV